MKLDLLEEEVLQVCSGTLPQNKKKKKQNKTEEILGNGRQKNPHVSGFNVPNHNFSHCVIQCDCCSWN